LLAFSQHSGSGHLQQKKLINEPDVEVNWENAMGPYPPKTDAAATLLLHFEISQSYARKAK